MSYKFLEEIELPEQGAPTPPVSGMSLYVSQGSLYAMKPNGSSVGPLGAPVESSAPANMLTTDSPQTITSSKTFTVAPLVPDGSFTIGKVNGLQSSLDSKYSSSNPPPVVAPSNMVTTDSTQTISGIKTFTSAPVLPGNSLLISNISGLQTSLDSKYSVDNPPPAGAAPANMMTTDTSQTMTAGTKTFGTGSGIQVGSNALFLLDGAAATSSATMQGSALLYLRTWYWNGTAGVSESAYFRGVRLNTSPGGMAVDLVGAPLRVTTISDSVGRIYTNVEPYIMAVTGNLTVQAGKSRIYVENASVIESVRASVNTAPAGGPVTVDVNLNGTSIYGTQANRPNIIAGANTALGGAPTSTAVAAGQYITVDVDAIGTTTAGADLTVVIRLRRT